MKQLSVSYECLYKEVKFFLICFLISTLINGAAIVAYQTHWIELLSQTGLVFILSFVCYLITVLFRFITDLAGLVMYGYLLICKAFFRY